MRLSKRRAKAGAQSTTNAVLVCKHRDMNEKELEAQVSAFHCLFCFFRAFNQEFSFPFYSLLMKLETYVVVTEFFIFFCLFCFSWKKIGIDTMSLKTKKTI